MAKEKEKYFSILVLGKEPIEQEQGELNPSTQQPAGPTNKIKLKNALMAIPNHSKVWGKRLKDKKDAYTGEIEFLKWGDKGGELIAIRYLAGAPSLDKNFQKNVLKLEFSDEESNQNAYIDLEVGVNDFDEVEADPLLIEFLKHHSYCRDNKSRNPRNSNILYELYNPENISRKKLDEMKKRSKAEEIILSAEDDEDRLFVLGSMFNLDTQQQDNVVFKELLELLEDDYNVILNGIESHAARFRLQLDDLLKAEILQIGEEDVNYILDGDAEFLLEGVDAKDKIQYMVDNIREPKVYDAYQKVAEIIEKRHAVLQ